MSSVPPQGSLSTLATLLPGRSACVLGLRVGDREGAWLRAVGLFEGITVTALRLAPWGGPLHLRTSNGAELAVDRRLAAKVDVAPVEP